MRLVEFLILLLEAHAQTLQRLAALFGEEILLHMLEKSGDKLENEPLPKIDLSWFQGEGPQPGFSTPYSELEGAVRGFNLSAVLEFHLWTFPLYRAFIESPLDLNSRIPGPGGDTGLFLADISLEQSLKWLKTLSFRKELLPQVEKTTQVPWLRFRTQVLKKVGKRPMGPVY